MHSRCRYEQEGIKLVFGEDIQTGAPPNWLTSSRMRFTLQNSSKSVPQPASTPGDVQGHTQAEENETTAGSDHDQDHIAVPSASALASTSEPASTSASVSVSAPISEGASGDVQPEMLARSPVFNYATLEGIQKDQYPPQAVMLWGPMYVKVNNQVAIDVIVIDSACQKRKSHYSRTSLTNFAPHVNTLLFPYYLNE